MPKAHDNTTSADLIRRSIIVAPANDVARIDGAVRSSADAICLDLEDTVTLAEKDSARAKIGAEIERCAAVADVLVRINGPWELALLDLESCVRPGLKGIRLPKAEHPDEVARVAARVSELEAERGLAVGAVGISLIIESVRGLFAARDLAQSSPRMESISLGHEDYARDLGVEPTPEGTEALLAQLGLILVAREASIHPLGSLGRVETPEAAAAAAAKLRSVGFRGAASTNPDLVPALNAAFSPGAGELRRAQRIVDAFDAAQRAGEGLISLPGVGMVDRPVADRARRLLSDAKRLQ